MMIKVEYEDNKYAEMNCDVCTDAPERLVSIIMYDTRGNVTSLVLCKTHAISLFSRLGKFLGEKK